ncbi:MAG: hypothetical protein R2849_19685 [Thermomicrobiales bacterium]
MASSVISLTVIPGSYLECHWANDGESILVPAVEDRARRRSAA